MASKLALVAFLVLLGLAQSGASWLGSAVGSGADVHVAASSEGIAFDGASVHAIGGEPLVPRGDHILWNAACWLFALGLAVSAGQRTVPQPALD